MDDIIREEHVGCHLSGKSGLFKRGNVFSRRRAHAFDGLADSNTHASQLYCPRHFSGQACQNAGSAYLSAIAEGQGICRQRYDSSEAAVLENFQGSLAVLSSGMGASTSNNACVYPSNNPLSSGQALSTGNDILQIAAADPVLGARIDRAIHADANLLMSGGSDPVCTTRIRAMVGELAQAKTFTAVPAHANPSRASTASASARVQTPRPSMPVQNVAPFTSVTRLSNSPPGAPPVPSLQAQARQAVSPAPQLQAQAVPAPAAGVPAAVPIFADSAQAPGDAQPSDMAQKQCASRAYQADVARQLAQYNQKGFFGRLWSHVTFSAPTADAQTVVDDPDPMNEFATLSPEKQSKYMSLCVTLAVPVPAQADTMTATTNASGPVAGGATAPQFVVTGGTGGASGAFGGGAPLPGANAGEPWPPACVTNMMVSLAEQQEQAKEHQGFFSRMESGVGGFFSHLLGRAPPPSSTQIAQDPQGSFEKLNMGERVAFLSACQHEIPTDQWSLATQQTGGRFVIPDYVKQQDLSASPVTPSSAGGSSWPPACALYALTDEINALKAQDQLERKWVLGGAIVGLQHFAGQGAPSDADEILKNPRAAFVKLSPDDQTKYMEVCLLQKDAALGFAKTAGGHSAVAGLMPGMPETAANGAAVSPLAPMSAPPQCAQDAMVKEISADLQDYRKRGAISQFMVRLFGNAPPSYDVDFLKDPAGQFQYLDPADQIKFMRACLPCPPKQPEPGVFKRVRNWFQNLGWFGKTLTVIVSAIAGALLWRIRGGWLPTGSTQAARGIAAGGMGLLGFLLGGPAGLLAGLLTMPELFIGWSQYLYAGNTGGTVALSNFLGMTFRGVEQTLGSGAVLAGAGFSPYFMVAGAMMGPIYSLTNKFLSTTKVFPNNPGGFITNSTTWAECFTGAWLFGSLAATLLMGSGNHAAIVSCIH